MMDVFNFLMNNDVFQVVSGIVTIASVIVRFTPNEFDNKILDQFSGFVNFLALNKPRK